MRRFVSNWLSGNSSKAVPAAATLTTTAPTVATTAQVGKPLAIEITNDPNVLAQPQVEVSRLALNGVQLGDATAAIPRGSVIIDARDVKSMQEMPEHNAYTTRGGKVVGFLLVDQALLAELRVASENGVQLRFGKADQVFDTGEAVVYYFYGRQLMVGWKGGRLAVVMVGEQ